VSCLGLRLVEGRATLVSMTYFGGMRNRRQWEGKRSEGDFASEVLPMSFSSNYSAYQVSFSEANSVLESP
jgi:hypothetical protein